VSAQERTELVGPASGEVVRIEDERQPSSGRLVPTRLTVSIVIIFLNAEKYLREAIESIFAQTYSDWELLLVDDGSNDGSTEIALSYTQRFPAKVYYLEHERHENRGMSASRNLGIRHARGEFVAMLDADDVWLPSKLVQQVAFMKQYPEVGLIANPAFYWYEDDVKKPQPMALFSGVLPPGAWVPEILENDNNAACPSSVLIRKTLLNQLGGFEESFRGPLMVFEDQVMWFKVSLNSPIYYHPEHLALYRIHSASCCMATPSNHQSAARIVLYSRLTEMLKGQRNSVSSLGLLTVMARSRLCEVLLQSLDQSPPNSENYRSNGRRLARLQNAVGDIRAYGHLLGPLFSGLLLFGFLFSELARRLSRRSFLFCKVAYAESFFKSTKAFSRSLIKAIGRIVLGWVKPFVRPVLKPLRTVKARVRLTAGLEPLSYLWGFDRGLPVHRYYLEQFLHEFACDIRGHCLEFQNPGYTPRFGGSAVNKLDILHIDNTNPLATIVADLTHPNDVPSNAFDCIICTHVLHVIGELDKAVSELYRILKPGGVLLVSVPHVSMCDPGFHEIWRFTPEGLCLVLAKAFGTSNVTVRAYGNSLTAAGEIRGLIAREFSEATLDYHDSRFAVEVCARACKPK